MGHNDPFESERTQNTVNGPDGLAGITTHPLRSTGWKNRPRPRHHPNASHDLLISERAPRHVERELGLLNNDTVTEGGTDRKTSVRPSIYRNCCGGENTRIREEEVRIRSLGHLQRCDGYENLLVGYDGDAVLKAAVKRHVGRLLRDVARASRPLPSGSAAINWHPVTTSCIMIH